MLESFASFLEAGAYFVLGIFLVVCFIKGLVAIIRKIVG